MKTRLAALAVLLMAGTASAAFAQDQDRHERGAGEQRPAGVPHEHHGGGGQWGGGERGQRPASAPQPAPQAQQAPQAQPAPPAREPRANFGGGGGRWGGQRPEGQQQAQPQFRPQPGQPVQARPDRRQGGDDGQRYVRRPGTWGDRDASPADRVDREDRGESRQWRRFGGGNPGAPAVDRRDDRRDGNRGGERQWNGGDHRDGDRRDGDRRWDGNRDHRNGYRDNHGRPEWRPGAYPHSFHSNQRFHWRSYVRPPHFYAHIWSFGEFLPQSWYGPEYVIEDWWDFDLPAPPPGYVWVRVGDDALLIDDYDGRVVQVVRELFW